MGVFKTIRKLYLQLSDPRKYNEFIVFENQIETIAESIEIVVFLLGEGYEETNQEMVINSIFSLREMLQVDWTKHCDNIKLKYSCTKNGIMLIALFNQWVDRLVDENDSHNPANINDKAVREAVIDILHIVQSKIERLI
jgi:hypothetical protein